MAMVFSLPSNLKLELEGDILVVIMVELCSLPSNLKLELKGRYSSCDHGLGMLSTKYAQTCTQGRYCSCGHGGGMLSTK